MKKMISVLMVAVALMMAAPAQAQLKFGVKGGMDFTKLDFDAKNVLDATDASTGFFIGPMAEFTLPLVGLGVDGALMFAQRGKGDLKQQGIEVPLNLKYTIGLGSVAGIYFAAGPDFFFNFKDVKATFVKGGDMLMEEEASKKTQVAVNLGVGLKLLRKLQLGVTYQIPMGDSFEWKDAANVVTAKNKTWQASLAFIF